MRISEVATAGQDLDFDHGTIIVREGGSKDRALMLPRKLGTQPARGSCRVHGHGG